MEVGSVDWRLAHLYFYLKQDEIGKFTITRTRI